MDGQIDGREVEIRMDGQTDKPVGLTAVPRPSDAPGWRCFPTGGPDR